MPDSRVPVLWGNLAPRAIAWGYWDTTILDDVLDRHGPAGTAPPLWQFPGGYRFGHYQGWTGRAGDPAVVIIPARHNLPYVDALNERLARCGAVIVILVGDEEHLFPWRELRHPRMAVWVMTPDPHLHAEVEGRRRFGTMYPPFTRPMLRLPSSRVMAWDKRLDWFFAGQATHARRHEAITAMELMPGGEFLGTPGFTQGERPDVYTQKLASAKIVPCPSGPATPDTFRLWESLEAACIPIADGATPKGPEPEFWPFLLGEDPPFPVVSSWAVLPHLVRETLLPDWPANANRISAWYQGYRRRLAYSLDQDVEEILGIARPEPTAADMITAIIPTSPIPPHPSTSIIVETVASIRARLGDCEIIIGMDGVRPEQEHRRADYETYQHRLFWLCMHEWTNVLPVRLERWGHQANATREMLALVRTPTVLFVEHDTPLYGADVPWADLAGILQDGEVANVIRLNHEASILDPHRHLYPESLTPVAVHGHPLLRTVQWSQRPHLARTDWYRSVIDRYFGPESRTMIEDALYGVIHTTWRERGMRGWRAWRVWMYAPPGDMQRSRHLDGRAGESKFEMVFRYEGETPEFAPNPLRDEDILS